MVFLIKLRDGNVYGPYPREDLLVFAAERRINPQDLLSEVGTDSWIPAVQILDSFPVQQPQQPAQQGIAAPNYPTNRKPPERVTLKLATWWPRVWSSIYDGLLFAIVFGMAGGVLILFAPKFGSNKLSLLFSLIYTIITTIFIASPKQATPGKQKFKLRVVALSGKELSFGHALARQAACLFVSFVPFVNIVSYLLPIWNQRKQTIHDMIARTVVITDK